MLVRLLLHKKQQQINAQEHKYTYEHIYINKVKYTPGKLIMVEQNKISPWYDSPDASTDYRNLNVKVIRG